MWLAVTFYDDEIDYMAIGKRIKTIRKKRKLNQNTLAYMAGIEPTSVSHIERAATKLSLPTLLKIANALEVTADELLCDNLTNSKRIYINEIEKAVENCSPKELRIITAIVNTAVTELQGKIK